MKALIDADVLLYECSSVAEYPKDEPVKSFDFVKEVFDNRVKTILHASGSEECTLFLTGEGNFREEIAVSKPYKGTRKEEKPIHYQNLKAYILSFPNAVLVTGMEADDAMSIEQSEDWRDCYKAVSGLEVEEKDASTLRTVICTRDKDLRMVPGWHYGWECGRQPEFRKRFIDELGYLELSKNKKSLKGGGLKFFYSQLLTGDKVDNIPGILGLGPVFTHELLKDCLSEKELFETVKGQYEMFKPDGWEDYLIEQARLLWMVKEVDEEGNPVMWDIPDV